MRSRSRCTIFLVIIVGVVVIELFEKLLCGSCQDQEHCLCASGSSHEPVEEGHEHSLGVLVEPDVAVDMVDCDGEGDPRYPVSEREGEIESVMAKDSLGDYSEKNHSQPIRENVVFVVFYEPDDATLDGLRAFFDPL